VDDDANDISTAISPSRRVKLLQLANRLFTEIEEETAEHERWFILAQLDIFHASTREGE
jgi:hypothetical protein